MNWIDFLLLVLLGVAVYAGWCLRGLMLVAAGLALILAPLTAGLFAPVLGPRLHPYVMDFFPGVQAAFWLVVALVAFLFFLVFRLLSGLFENLKLGWLDQSLGAAFMALVVFYMSSVFFLQVVAKNPGAKTGPAMKGSWFCRKAFPQAKLRLPSVEDYVARLFPAREAALETPLPLKKHSKRKLPRA
jgi:uncharacterized membrane protein required for colicin V production